MVVWHNGSQLAHTVTDDPTKAQDPTHAVLPSGAPAWDSGDVYPGNTWSRRFDVPGAYLYFCCHHEAEGMFGTIAVSG